MSKVQVKLNRKGIADLMKSNEMQTVLNEHANKIKNRCGDGYEQDIHIGRNRANAMVSAATYRAKADNMKNNTILKAVK